MLWDVLIVGRFKSWTFSDGTFFEWDVSRAGPFVCALLYMLHRKCMMFTCIKVLNLLVVKGGLYM